MEDNGLSPYEVGYKAGLNRRIGTVITCPYILCDDINQWNLGLAKGLMDRKK